MAKKSEKLREELEAALAAEQELAERYGINEPENDSDVAYIRFTRDGGDINRVAIREKGNWFVTGEEYSFATLADFVMQAEELWQAKFVNCWSLSAPALSVGDDDAGLEALFAAFLGNLEETGDDEDSEDSTGPSEDVENEDCQCAAHSFARFARFLRGLQ